MLHAKKWHFGSLPTWLWRMFSGFILDKILRTRLTPLVSPILTIKTQQPRSPKKYTYLPKRNCGHRRQWKGPEKQMMSTTLHLFRFQDLLAQSSPISLFAVLLYTKTDEWFPGFLLFWVVTIITAGYCCKQLRSSYLADSNSTWINAISQCLPVTLFNVQVSASSWSLMAKLSPNASLHHCMMTYLHSQVQCSSQQYYMCFLF